MDDFTVLVKDVRILTEKKIENFFSYAHKKTSIPKTKEGLKLRQEQILGGGFWSLIHAWF